MTETVADFLSHHGVKGMHWGVITEDKSGDKSSLQKDLKKSQSKTLSDAEKKNLADNEKKHESHFEPSDDSSSKGWRPTKKQVAIAAVGAIVAAGIIYKIKSGNAFPGKKAFSVEEYLGSARESGAPPWLKKYSGKAMTSIEYNGIKDESKGRIWIGNNFITKESFDHPEFTLQPGHQFFRISQRAEKGFGDTTYATSSKEDFARYLASWNGVKTGNAHQIQFNAIDSVRIPNLHTRLEAMRETMVLNGEKDITPKRVIEEYSRLSGGTWETPTGRSFLDNLRSKGFHAIVDDMDAGIYGESPLVLIDKSRFGNKTATPLDSIDRNYFESILTDIPNRR